MMKISLVLATMLFAFKIFAADTAVAEPEWQPTNEKNGIKIFKKDVPDSKIIAFKGEATIDASMAQVANVVSDYARAKEWVTHIESTKIIVWLSETEFLDYVHIGTPFILRDRDFVSHVTMKFDREKKTMVFEYKAATESEIPEEYKDKGKYIRGDLGGTAYTLTSLENGTKTYVIGEIRSDPKGAIPKWLVNFFQSDWPYDTLRSLRRQVTKKNIQEIPKMTQLLKTKLGL